MPDEVKDVAGDRVPRSLDEFVRWITRREDIQEAVRSLSAVEINEYGAVVERQGMAAVQLLMSDRKEKADPGKQQAYVNVWKCFRVVDQLPVSANIKGFIIKKLNAIVKHAPQFAEGRLTP